MQDPAHGGFRSSEITPWEWDSIRRVARTFRTDEREDLEAELARTLALLKSRPPTEVRNWKAYLTTALHNSARSWIRRNRPRGITLPITFPGDQEPSGIFVREDALPLGEGDSDLRIAVRQLWAELGPALRRLWAVLAEENGNQAATARRLGKHRNTVRRAVQQIRRAIVRHGLRDAAHAIPHNTVTPARPLRRNVQKLENHRFQAVKLIHAGLNQTEVAHRMNVARQTVCRWIKQYRQAGDAGLRKSDRAGRKPRLTSAQMERLVQILKRDRQTSRRPGWSCPRVAKLIKRRFGVTYHPGHVWKLLKALRRSDARRL